MRAGLPFHLQFFLSLHRRPSVVRQHRDPTQRLIHNWRLESVDRFGSLHTSNAQRRLVINRFWRAAQNRRMHYARIQHSVHAHVLPVNCFSGAQILQVVAHRIFPDVPPLAARLQFQIFLLRYLELRRRFSQLAIPQFLSRSLVHHRVQFRRAFRGRHFPLLRCRPHHHQTRRPTCLAQRNEKADHRVRSIRILIPVFLVPNRLHHLHPRPIRIELVRDDPRQRRAHAIPHLRPVRDHVHSPVRIDRQINARLQHRLLHRVRGIDRTHIRARRQQFFRHQTDANHKRTRASHPLQKSTTAKVFDRNHEIPPRYMARPTLAPAICIQSTATSYRQIRGLQARPIEFFNPRRFEPYCDFSQTRAS